MVFLLTGFLVFVRVVAVTMTAPILGNRIVGLWPRLVIASGLAMVACPLVPPPEFELSPVVIGGAIFAEALVGALMGFGMTVLFASASAAGSMIGQMAGLQLFGADDSTAEIAGSPVSQLFGLVSIAVFALMGGMELVFSGVLDSFASLPLGTEIESANLIWLLTQLLQQCFVLVLKCVAPSIVAMLIATYVIGMLNRTFPSMNSMGIGLSSNLVIMLLAVFLTLGGTMWLLVDDMQQATEWLNSTFKQMTSG